jgi:hypothetical protein
VGVAPGKSYREPDTTYLFLDWQFMPQWSMVATGGDKGTSILDVIFQGILGPRAPRDRFSSMPRPGRALSRSK